MIHFALIALFFLLLLMSPLIIGAVLLYRKNVRAGLAVFGGYIAIILSVLVCVFIYGNLERRTTAGHIVRWFEGEFEYQQYADDLAEDTKKVVNPVELQQWATNVLQETETTNYPVGDFPRDKVLPA